MAQVPRVTPLCAPPGAATLRLRAPAVAGQPVDRFLAGEAPPPGRRGRASTWLTLALAGLALGGALGVTVYQVRSLPGPSVSSPSPDSPAPALPAVRARALEGARRGRLLGAGSILKADHYPGLHQAALQGGRTSQPLLPGAPNFRHLVDSPIYGVAQPTVEGIRQVLRQAGSGPGGRPALWVNLREEPVIYLNGRPFNVRQKDHPFANRENPGVSAEQVEAEERLLQQEILAEARAHGGRVLVHEEAPDGRLEARWEKVDSVQTTREVYDGLGAEGFPVRLVRVPVTDEQAPEPQDFDALVAALGQAPPGSAFIFNCHAGRGRTTTGMVVADLWSRGGAAGSLTRRPSVHEDIREQGRYERGEYRAILALIRALEEGPRAKAEADSAIDRSASVQNLREAILHYKRKAEAGSPEARQRGLHYLRRYFFLVAFDAYLKDGARGSFQQWLAARPELTGLLENLELVKYTPPPENPPAYYV
jgi:hypothetical protein